MVTIEFNSTDVDKIALIRKFARSLADYKKITGGYGTVINRVGEYQYSLKRVKGD